MQELYQYNTQNDQLIISEYGRSFQNMVKHVCTINEPEKRLKMAEALIGVMEILNPTAKNQTDYKQKLWDHLYIISEFKLDVNAPFPAPEINKINQKPERIPYPSQPIKYRFYGRNLQLMANKAASIENPELKNEFVNLLASFMTNSSKSWNNENLNNQQLAEHLETLSNKQLKINPEELELTIDNNASPMNQNLNKKKKFFKPNNKFKNNKFKNNNNRK
jgi:hypothetical protein